MQGHLLCAADNKKPGTFRYRVRPLQLGHGAFHHREGHLPRLTRWERFALALCALERAPQSKFGAARFAPFGKSRPLRFVYGVPFKPHILPDFGSGTSCAGSSGGLVTSSSRLAAFFRAHLPTREVYYIPILYATPYLYFYPLLKGLYIQCLSDFAYCIVVQFLQPPQINAADLGGFLGCHRVFRFAVQVGAA